MKDKTLVVMAAGLGSRFGGLKQLEPVGPNGEFIIDYSIYDAKRAGFDRVVFVIKKELEEAFRSTIGKRIENQIEVKYAYQEISDVPDKKYLVEKRSKPWGTLHAVLCARKYVDGDFLVINADDFYGYDSFLKASKFLDENRSDDTYASICFPYIVTASKFGSVKRAICFSDGDDIQELVESKVTTKGAEALCEPLNGDEEFSVSLDHPVAVNMFVFKHKIFDYLEEYYKEFFKQDDEVILNSEVFLPALVKDKVLSGDVKLKKVISDSKWLGITYKEDLEPLKSEIRKLVKKGEYPEKLWN